MRLRDIEAIVSQLKNAADESESRPGAKEWNMPRVRLALTPRGAREVAGILEAFVGGAKAAMIEVDE